MDGWVQVARGLLLLLLASAAAIRQGCSRCRPCQLLLCAPGRRRASRGRRGMPGGADVTSARLRRLARGCMRVSMIMYVSIRIAQLRQRHWGGRAGGVCTAQGRVISIKKTGRRDYILSCAAAREPGGRTVCPVLSAGCSTLAGPTQDGCLGRVRCAGSRLSARAARL